MYSELPILPNKFYNKTSGYQDLYNTYIGFGAKTNHIFEETLLIRCINVIYEDFINNGFGSDWSTELNRLYEFIENNKKLSNLTFKLNLLDKYAKGYKIDKEDIWNISDQLEDIMSKILIYVDETRPWTKLKNSIEI